MMTQATVAASDRRARFVGEEAYVAAGGRIEADLFSDEERSRWLDVALLERLASEKMDTLAAAAAEEQGLAFVRPTLDGWIGCSATEGLRRVPLPTPPLTDEESARVERLETELEQLVETLEDERVDEPERVKAGARVRELGDSIDALVNKPPVIADELKPKVGRFLMLDDEGRPRLDTAFYADIAAEEVAGLGDESDGAPGQAGDEPASLPGLSRRLADELAIQRRDILAVHVAADPGFALDLAIFLMADRGERHWGETCGSSLSARAPDDPVRDFQAPDSPATIAQAQSAAQLDRSWTEHPTLGERFDAFRSLSDDARAAWLGHCIARTLEASIATAGERACAFHDHLGQRLGIEVERWWRPTGANYFDRVPKSLSLAALAEIGGPALSRRYAKAKKAELAQACERIFSGDIIAEAEVKAAALAWVPDAMRFGELAAADPDADSGDQSNVVERCDSSGPPEPEANAIGEAA
jgi:ParB family chromosome partitioning protein